MPAIGLGTSKLVRCEQAVATALRAGYRLVDTARKYDTEAGVSEGIRVSGIARRDIFIVTKVSHENLRAADFARSVDESLAALKSDYVDLLLINWPSPDGIPLAETIGALARARREGLARNIGLCNYTIALLKDAMRLTSEPLTVLQAEYHPYLDQFKLLEFCREAGLVFMAYCPVRHKDLFTDPVLVNIARTHDKTVSQIVLRWLIQQGNIVPIPRSQSPQHIAENIAVFDFELTADEMNAISGLKRPDGRLSQPAGLAPHWD
jgi:diketogulonate reductase-like aldo/keto reductase